MVTTNKGLNQPATSSENWDVPLNANFGYIDSSLGGTTGISVTGQNATPVLLTVTQYRSLILSFTGVLTSNVTYLIPSGVGGQWIVTNDTTQGGGGPYTLSIDNAATGASVIIPSGSKKSVFSDGTNIYLVGGDVTSVDVSGGTTGLTTSGGPITSSGTITLGGTLAVANGGTGATSAGQALTNLGGQAALGFTPVQQGGPVGTGSNKIYLGWRADSTGIVVQVDTGGYLGRMITNAYSGGATSGYPQSTQLFAPGDAPLFACRAWVNFNGYDSSVRGSGNVTSISSAGQGLYVVNMTIPMPDANYATVVTVQGDNGDPSYSPSASIIPAGVSGAVYSTSQVGVMSTYRIFNQSGGRQYTPTVCVAIFR